MKHKHCELIKQWADGAEIQVFNLSTGEWEDIQCTPSWGTHIEYRIKPTKLPEGFTPWFGGECPFEDGTLVDVVYRDGEVLYALAANDLASNRWRDASCAFWNHENHPADIVGCRRSVKEKQPVVRWLWAYQVSSGGYEQTAFLTEEEAFNYPLVLTQLEWSRTEFPE